MCCTAFASITVRAVGAINGVEERIEKAERPFRVVFVVCLKQSRCLRVNNWDSKLEVKLRDFSNRILALSWRQTIDLRRSRQERGPLGSAADSLHRLNRGLDVCRLVRKMKSWQNSC